MLKKILSVVLMACAASTASAQWYLGGTLHKSTLSEWNRATASNQMATLADIIAATNKTTEPDEVKPIAVRVRACVNEMASNSKFGTQKVSEAAVMCMFQLGYLPR